MHWLEANRQENPGLRGTIPSVFASLSGEKAVALPDGFSDLKREILHSPDLQHAVCAAWVDLCHHLSVKTKEIADAGNSDIVNGVAPSLVEQIKASGTVVVRGVVPEQKALKCLDPIKQYIAQNPEVKGFPEYGKAVFEL
ncbi:hypothetical protein QFC24_002143 [Naganishia onofrii]|uniref:Uncharacterized protein n=1 Tax=Naganishia onofrii TaxID=1851511 RepID=A0ACC2XSR3_9TREE|nr:hypothetical protein QFC24_002143 [Naganishia onofrii]